MASADQNEHGFIDAIAAIARSAAGRDRAVAEIVDALDERATALLVLLFAIPCLVPGLPGAQIIAIPIFLLAGQLAIGREEPWLPQWFLRMKVKAAWIEGVGGFSSKRLRWTERLSQPRLSWLSGRVARHGAGFVMALAAVTIMLPITNTIPSLSITVMAVGLLQRDGLFIGAGALLALAWIGLLSAIVGGLVFGASFAVSLVGEYAPWLGEWLGLSRP